MSEDKTYVPAILDRQIAAEAEDAFGHRHFSQMLRGIIESDSNSPPFSIGLLGDWGCGKSSIKSMYEADLRDDQKKDRSGFKRNQRIQSLTFNAWRFGGEDIKRALLRHVFLGLGGCSRELNDALFRQVQTESKSPKTLKELWLEFYDRWIFGLLILGVLYAGCFSALLLAVKIFGIDSAQWTGLIGIASLLSPVFLFKPIFESDQRLSRYRSNTSTEDPITSAERFEDLLIRQIKLFAKKKGKGCQRLVVFIDDLDRLSAEEMISGLDAIRTFMEIPSASLPEGFGLVFVISCDEARVADALAKRNRREAELPAVVFNQSDARRYLDRIFQFRLEIPPFPKRDMRTFAEGALREALPKLSETLEANGTSLETLVDRMIHVGVTTPRKALQIVNAFVQSWWIASRRENDAKGTDREGGLCQGAVTDHPMSLAVLSTVRVDFPGFYSHVQKTPELIQHFTDVFVSGDGLTEKPEPIQLILKKYADDEDKLRVEYHPLRQFIASLRGLRWPPSLEPLLLLSQDPVSRKFGDRAPALYQSFISGDHHGVLIQLGKQNDQKQLSRDNVRFLGDLWEEIGRESITRRNNAASVLAELAPRLPSDSAHLLLSPLARQLAASLDLRCRLGIENIAQTLMPADLNDQKAVAQQLIDDLLREEGDIAFTMPTGEKPSLEEASKMIADAVPMILRVRSQVEFSAASDEALRQWLLSRRVAVAGKEFAQPLSHLESWMGEHESWLLDFLGSDYTQQVAESLSEGESHVKPANAIKRCGNTFDQLVTAGEDSRQQLWPQLCLLVSVDSPEVVLYARAFYAKHGDTADAASAAAFVDAYGQRIAQTIGQASDSEAFLDVCDAVHHFCPMLKQSASAMGEDAQQAIQELVQSLAANGHPDEAVEILESLKQAPTDIIGEVTTAWQGDLLDETVPTPCRVWIGKNLSLFDEELVQSIASTLDTVHTRANISSDEADRYLEVIKHVPEDMFEIDSFQSHIQKLFAQIGQQHGNEDYVYQVFRAVPVFLPHAAPSHTGNMLHTLFTNAANRPRFYGWLCHWMRRHWMEKTTDLGSYAPQTIFDNANKVVTQHESEKWSYGALQTMSSMAAKGIAGETSDVASGVFRVFPYHPQKAMDVLRSIETIPSASEVVSVLDHYSDDLASEIPELFETVAGIIDPSQAEAIAIEILSYESVLHGETPDYCFHCWIDLQSNRDELLESVLLNESLNDEQRKRVWLQIESHHKVVNRDLFLKVLPALCEVELIPQTLDEVAGFSQEITELFASADDRVALGETVLKCLVLSATLDFKKHLAHWLHSLDVSSVLKLVALNEDDLTVLEPHFNKDRTYKALVRKSNKAKAD